MDGSYSIKKMWGLIGSKVIHYIGKEIYWLNVIPESSLLCLASLSEVNSGGRQPDTIRVRGIIVTNHVCPRCDK